MPLPSQVIAKKFPFTPTQSQQRAFALLDQFLIDGPDLKVMVINGYAGTGKTTLISEVVKILPLFNLKQVLMAPTGRAAKVMSKYSGKMAFTIHSKIYRQTAEPGHGLRFQLQKSYHKNTVFIVDEASMLSDEATGAVGGLLNDVLQFVTGNGNRLILVGDTAQLPPIGLPKSPSLQPRWLADRYKVEVVHAELKEVMRQETDSGILHNATMLRKQMASPKFKLQFYTDGFGDIYRMNSNRMEDGIRYAYDKYGIHQTVIICRSNKQAVMYNHFIRNQIHFHEQEVEAGDVLMIARNNYFYVPGYGGPGFVANGDFVEVRKIVSFEEMYGLRFATLELVMVDYADQPQFEAKVILDTLHMPVPSMPEEDYRKFYDQVVADYQDLDDPKEQRQAIKEDPYLNALQVKYAYALTCHKSQGGQWKAVFVDQGYLPEDRINEEFQKWLYTALTRATDELFLVNFDPKFFKLVNNSA